MAIDKKLAELIAKETDANKIASIVMSYNNAKAKEKKRLNERKSFIKNFLKTASNKVNEGNLDAIAFEFAYANKDAFREWLVTHKPELFVVKKKDKKTEEKKSEANSDEASKQDTEGTD